MSSKRMIDPALWQSETMSQLTCEQRLLFIGLFSNADDQGRLRGHPSLIRSLIFPYDDISIKKITADLEAIEAIGSIHQYQVDGKCYIQVVGWWDYQSLQWGQPSKLPAPEEWADSCRYRRGGKVVTENWDGNKGFANKPLPKPLPKDLPKPLPGPIDQYSIDESSIDEFKEEEPKKPPKSIKKSRKAPIKKKTPPPKAVKAFQAGARSYPHKSTWVEIVEVVGEERPDLEFWELVVRKYIAQGWNPGGVDNMLDFFKKREIPTSKKGNNNGSHIGPPPKPTDEAAEYQRRLRMCQEKGLTEEQAIREGLITPPVP